MGYKIYTDGELIGRTGSRDYAILEGAANLAVNAAGSLTFTVAPKNPVYAKPQKLASIISLQRDGEEIFRGRALDWETDFYNCRQFICEGALAFLRDVLKPPFTVSAAEGMTPHEYLRRLLEQYNAACDPRRQIQLGNVTVSGTVSVRHSKEWKSIFDLTSELVALLGGYMIVRYNNGLAYLDYLASATDINSENVQYGKNLLDLQQHSSAASVFNVIVPIGKDGLTIESVNSGSPRLENAASIALVGRIEIPRSYDTDDPEELKSLAQAELAAGIYAADTITVDAALLGRVELGSLVPVKSNPHDVSISLQATAITLNLVDATGDGVTLGSQLRTMTGQSSPVSKLDTAQQTVTGGIVPVDMADYIVEQGTSGIWTYRKWASGVAECWGVYTISNAVCNTAWGQIYETANYYYTSFPSGLFAATPVTNLSVQGAEGVNTLSLEVNAPATKDRTQWFYITRATSGTLTNCYIAIHAIGRWK